VRSEGFYVNENPLTLAGIEPATFRFVAQHLDHCGTAIPHRTERRLVNNVPQFVKTGTIKDSGQDCRVYIRPDAIYSYWT